MNMKKTSSLLLSLLLLGSTVNNSYGAIYTNGNKTANFDVTLTIIADCAISVTPLNFGTSQGNLTTAVNATSTVNVLCTNTTPYNVGLNAGTGTGSTGTTRYMNGTGANTSTVQFNLYQDAGKTVLWGDTQGSTTHSGTGSGVSQSISLYGVIPVQNTPQPDSYKSTITATVYF